MELHKQTAALERGVTSASLSHEAQEQLRALLGVSMTARDRALQHHIRTSLAFPEMHERRQIVEKAHIKTFRWLVEEVDPIQIRPVKADARARYIKWLGSGAGIFHIMGKPGSGKSTLMKFLSGHDRTSVELHKWAGKHEANFSRNWTPTYLFRPTHAYSRELLLLEASQVKTAQVDTGSGTVNITRHPEGMPRAGLHRVPKRMVTVDVFWSFSTVQVFFRG